MGSVGELANRDSRYKDYLRHLQDAWTGFVNPETAQQCQETYRVWAQASVWPPSTMSARYATPTLVKECVSSHGTATSCGRWAESGRCSSGQLLQQIADKAYEDMRLGDRYATESARLLAVLDQRLARRNWVIGGDYRPIIHCLAGCAI